MAATPPSTPIATGQECGPSITRPFLISQKKPGVWNFMMNFPNPRTPRGPNRACPRSWGTRQTPPSVKRALGLGSLHCLPREPGTGSCAPVWVYADVLPWPCREFWCRNCRKVLPGVCGGVSMAEMALVPGCALPMSLAFQFPFLTFNLGVGGSGSGEPTHSLISLSSAVTDQG